MTILLLAEHDGQHLKGDTYKVLTAAQAIGGPIDLLVAGENCQSVLEQAQGLGGISKLLSLDHPLFAGDLAEPLSAHICALAENYTYFLAPATSFGKNVMPRVAAALDVMQVSDVTKILSKETFERPIYAGNAFEQLRVLTEKKVLTIRPTSFTATKESAQTPPPVVRLDVQEENEYAATSVTHIPSQADRPDLASARVVISGGQAFGTREKFESYLFPLADKLGAAIGATRAAVDAGYAPNEWQVGQTGKVVAPEVYIAFGISGAIQHTAGMRGAKTIISVNTDEEAPILKVSDYYFIGDIFEVIPEILKHV